MFNHLKKIQYNDPNLPKQIANISSAFHLRRIEVEQAYVFQRYTLGGYETPEYISNKLYGTPEYYWVIMIVNHIVDPFLDWPVNHNAIDGYVKKKYANSEAIHHFYDVDKERICDDYDTLEYRRLYSLNPTSLPAHIRPVTNYEHEIELNMQRKDITVVHPRAIKKFAEDFRLLSTESMQKSQVVKNDF